VHTGPGRDRIDMQGATSVGPAFVANDPHHGLFAPRKSGGHRRR
jgi:hypothetical protein